MGSWISDNTWIQWVFSGIGVLGISAIWSVIRKSLSKKQSEDQAASINQAQIIGGGSTIYQAGGDINLPSEQKPKYDETFYDRVIQKLDEDNFVYFIESVLNHCSVDNDELYKFREFVQWASKPSNSFNNLQAQTLFNEFLEKCHEFSSFIGTHFFYRRRSNDTSLRYLYPDLNADLDGNCAPKEMEKYDKYYDELSTLCCKVIEKYKEFVQESKRIIFV